GPAPVTVLPQAGDASLRLLRRAAAGGGLTLDDYRAAGGDAAVRRAVALRAYYSAAGGYPAVRRAVELGPEGVIRELKDSKLQGRGGAAFPTGVKWEAVARQPVRPPSLGCNDDASAPG